jgi:hypothetical protein
LLAADRIRGAGGSLSVRNQQKRERDQLSKTIAEANNKIAELSQQKLPLQQSLQKLETEVGPLKYIAALIYGDNLNASLLESAVRGVILLLVAVFDPLAIMMVLAATESFRWHAEKQSAARQQPESVARPKHIRRWAPIVRTKTQKDQPAEDPPAEAPPPLAEELIEPESGEILSEPALEFEPAEVSSSKRLVSDMAELDRQQSQEFHDHVQIGGKYYHANTLSKMLKDASDKATTGVKFGVTFPSNPKINEMFLRVDYLPTRLFRYDGTKWVAANKESTTQPLYDQAYIEMLITKIGQGEYNPNWLAETERAQIEKILQSDLNQKGA